MELKELDQKMIAGLRKQQRTWPALRVLMVVVGILLMAWGVCADDAVYVFPGTAFLCCVGSQWRGDPKAHLILRLTEDSIIGNPQ
ncbi:MAG: hypothetical protein QME60_00240 [Verrucomicrobiota bacterium]|nr:hypothetical protein [Verrucomicrobiota bacterium]